MSKATGVSRQIAWTQRTGLTLGVLGLAALGAGYMQDPAQFHHSYLIAYLYWLGPTLGSLAIIMLNQLTGGAWGFSIRRLLEAAMRNLPLMAVAFVPILLGIPTLYEWSHADVVAEDPVLMGKAPYLNTPFFVARAIFYFAAWSALAFGLIRLAARYDRTLDVGALRKIKVLSGLGLCAYVLTMSFAAFDWGMSLEPHWFSTIYGVHFVIGQVLTTLCLAILAASRLAAHEPFSRWIERSHFHDLGNLTMAFVMLWAYISFSQFLIVWSGNLPEETPWYLNRLDHGWQLMALALVVLHFFVPFLILLDRRTKRSRSRLATIASGILVLRFVDYYWMIAPAFAHGEGPHLSWMDIIAPLALGALWIGAFARNLRGRPLVSLQDAKLLGQLEEVPSR